MIESDTMTYNTLRTAWEGHERVQDPRPIERLPRGVSAIHSRSTEPPKSVTTSAWAYRVFAYGVE